MNPRTADRRRPALAAGLAAALLLGALWFPTHRALPLLPTDDLYEHLSVTRHLARGEGFLCDIAYPLSFAWPFARELPQPLLHRPPGWPVILLAPYGAVAGDPARMLTAVRVMQVILLALIAGLGTAAWARRGRFGAAAAWLAALVACPLWPYAVDWGQAEVAAAALLLTCWVRHRDGSLRAGPIDGLLVGLLALLRPELVWLPVAWIWWLRRGADRGAAGRGRGLLLAIALFVILAAPWAVRNTRLTGHPFFSVQASAEMAKDTRTWPGYDVYRQLDPQPWWRVLREAPEPVARKTARGLKFFGSEWPGLLPWPMPLLLVAGLVVRRRAPRIAGVDGNDRPGAPRGPEALALTSFAALAVLYAPLDHSLRHLLVLVPVLAWEAAPWLGEWPWSWRGPRPRDARTAAAVAVALALATAIPTVLLTAREPTGWAGARREAAAGQDAVLAEAARLRAAPRDEVQFVQTSAAPWLADRAAVWSPLDGQTAARIRAWLSPAADAVEKP